MADGTKFELCSKLSKIVHEEIEIKGLDWKITGNFLQHDFDVVNERGLIVASSHKKWVSLHEGYEIEVTDEAHLDTIVAIFAVLDHILTAREENTSASISGSTNNG